ncbi:MAG: transcription termination/antitermination protein NusG [Parvibaculales bacterium]
MTTNSLSPSADCWYLAQLKPNGFAKAQVNLQRQKFETFMPLCRMTIRQGQKFAEHLKPVFPGYLFVRFGADRKDWRKINSTLGVARLVSFAAASPVSVPEKLMAGLMARCDKDDHLQPPNDLEIGERVKLVSGPFAGFVGEVETFIGDDRVRMLYEFMGQSSHLDVTQKDLERL